MAKWCKINHVQGINFLFDGTVSIELHPGHDAQSSYCYMPGM